MGFPDLTITSLETITAFNVTSGDYLFTLDELQNTSIAQTQDKVDMTGKGGRKLNSLKRNKAVTISGANGMVSGGLLEMQTGGTFRTTAGTTANPHAEVAWCEYITVTGTAGSAPSGVATTYKAVGTSGSEIVGLYIHNDDGTLGEQLTQAGSAASGKFVYNASTKAITFNNDFFTGSETSKEIVVYYNRKIAADVLVNESDVFSGKATLYVDALAEDKCANVYRIQFFIPKADFNGEFTFEMGDNQTVHNFEAEALAGACGTSGQLWTLTVFGANAADAT